jgi:hypothetical protein
MWTILLLLEDGALSLDTPKHTRTPTPKTTINTTGPALCRDTQKQSAQRKKRLLQINHHHHHHRQQQQQTAAHKTYRVVVERVRVERAGRAQAQVDDAGDLAAGGVERDDLAPDQLVPPAVPHWACFVYSACCAMCLVRIGAWRERMPRSQTLCRERQPKNARAPFGDSSAPAPGSTARY